MTTERPFLFMSGEFRVSMPEVFKRENWAHTMTPDELIYENSILRRKKYPRENLQGVIFYADVDNKDIEIQNLKTLKRASDDFNVAVWPDPERLLDMVDRHKVLETCIYAGLVTHPVWQGEYKNFPGFKTPFVVKTGLSHRGIGKHLVDNIDDLPAWDGIATVEPYFKGESVRVLLLNQFLEDGVFGIRIKNDNSWIKNSGGAEIESFIPDSVMVEHARSVAMQFGLDVAGVDYILEDNGSFHFLEINQFPGMASTDEIEAAAKKAINKRMDKIEINAAANYENRVFMVSSKNNGELN